MNKKKINKIPTTYVLFILIFVCIASLLLSAIKPKVFDPIRNNVSKIVIPLQEGINDIGKNLTHRRKVFAKVKKLEKTNKQLKQQIDELTQENSLLSQNKYELERLRELYELDNTYSEYEKIACRVVGKDSGNWFNLFTINKGKKDGIETGMNVISGSGLVGIVSETYEDHATVRAIIDDESAVSVKFASSSDLGIVSGDLEEYSSGQLRLTNVKKEVEVKEGDMVLTSHVSTSFLPGILIGYVSEISLDSNDLAQSGYIIPVVDFEHLDEVLVIKQTKENYEDDYNEE